MRAASASSRRSRETWSCSGASRPNSLRPRLRDAHELFVRLEHRAVVAQRVAVALDAVEVDGTFRARLTSYALEPTGWHLRSADGGDPGARREAPVPQLALPPGPSAARPEPEPFKRERDSVDNVLAQLDKFVEEFGDLEDEDE